ncbi:MAG: hypothetical protein ACTS73_09875 [Arsenophonus sp. NEOnobi-MAG3]
MKNTIEITGYGKKYLADKLNRKDVKIGSVIKMPSYKDGETTVKVLMTNWKGNKHGWSEQKRNNWRIENHYAIEIKLTPFE